MMTLGALLRSHAAAAALALLAGCNLVDGLKASPHDGHPGGQPVTVTLTPASPTVPAGGTLTFVATVTGAADTSVVWAVPGTGCGTISDAGHYLAPMVPGACSVTATSVADPARSATAQVTVTAPGPVTVTVSPSAGAVDACRTLTFTATVTGSADGVVTWSVQEAGGGNIVATGVYTAPQTPGTYHVVATSHADPTRQAVVSVAVASRVLSVTVTPAVVQVPANGSTQFTATVTTTCGSFLSTSTLHADGTLTR
jgi:hypothetical protein